MGKYYYLAAFSGVKATMGGGGSYYTSRDSKIVKKIYRYTQFYILPSFSISVGYHTWSSLSFLVGNNMK